MIPLLSPLLRVMTCPLIITPLYSMKIFAVKTFTNCSKTAKFAKVFTCKRFPLYDMLCSNCSLSDLSSVTLGITYCSYCTLLTLILPQTENENTMKRPRHDVSSSPNVSYILLKMYITFKYWTAMFSI